MDMGHTRTELTVLTLIVIVLTSVACKGLTEYEEEDATSDGDPCDDPHDPACCAVRALSGGLHHMCALLGNGSVKCWGRNDTGQLGDGTTVSRATPVEVAGLGTGVTGISAGYNHTCAVLRSGELRCWGENLTGKLGDGTLSNRRTPVTVEGLASGVTKAVAGENHTCALLDTGSVQCWGANTKGQLGNGSTIDSRTPVDVEGLPLGVTELCSRHDHNCVFLSTGSMMCWGANTDGRLGDGSTGIQPSPVAVVALPTTPVTMACGGFHTCVVLPTGGVMCWGRNAEGQVGDGTFTDRYSAVHVSGLASGVGQMCTSPSAHSCATVTGGGLKCWGKNEFSRLGDGTTTDRNVPVDVIGLMSGASIVACGGAATCALLSTGDLMCWGNNEYGQIGIGSLSPFESTPRQVSVPCP